MPGKEDLIILFTTTTVMALWTRLSPLSWQRNIFVRICFTRQIFLIKILLYLALFFVPFYF